jgi:hypothetical protein
MGTECGVKAPRLARTDKIQVKLAKVWSKQCWGLWAQQVAGGWSILWSPLLLFKDHPLAFSTRNLSPEIKVSPKWVWRLVPLPAAVLLGLHLAICSPSALACIVQVTPPHSPLSPRLSLTSRTQAVLGRVTLNLQWLAPSRNIFFLCILPHDSYLVDYELSLSNHGTDCSVGTLLVTDLWPPVLKNSQAMYSNQMLLVTCGKYNRCRPYSEILTVSP